MVKWITQIARMGMVEIGEYWRDVKCEVCGAERCVICIATWEGYDMSASDLNLCAQCLRNLANNVDKFENAEID